MIGAATLAPPARIHACAVSKLSYADTGVFGSATAAMSLVVRWGQPGSVCHVGFGSMLHPLPVPALPDCHTVSDHARRPDAGTNEVPPTAITCGLAAGEPTPYQW